MRASPGEDKGQAIQLPDSEAGYDSMKGCTDFEDLQKNLIMSRMKMMFQKCALYLDVTINGRMGS